VLPRLDKELPFHHDEKHGRTRREFRRLCDIYTEEWMRPTHRIIAVLAHFA